METKSIASIKKLKSKQKKYEEPGFKSKMYDHKFWLSEYLKDGCIVVEDNPASRSTKCINSTDDKIMGSCKGCKNNSCEKCSMQCVQCLTRICMDFWQNLGSSVNRMCRHCVTHNVVNSDILEKPKQLNVQVDITINLFSSST